MFTFILIVYMLVMYLVGYLGSRRVESVDDYVLAGRSLPLSLTTVTMVATWFGAESLMTTADKVAAEGWRGALLDPIGISLCLLLTGMFIAAPMWRMNVLTIPDFFRLRYGPLAEILSSIVLVPSYFGWIAAQYTALATILSQLYGGSISTWIIVVALLGSGYSLMGGMWSITLTDALQLVLIVVGLVILGVELLQQAGQGSLWSGWQAVRAQTPPEFWRVADPATFSHDVMLAISVLAIGALGNIPVQDLMQRVFSARSPRVASTACYLASVGYLLMGLLPILAGLSASVLLKVVPEEGVLTMLAARVLSPLLGMVLLLAIISAVLSTMVSAVMAPSAVLAHNLIEPWLLKQDTEDKAKRQLILQRSCVLGVTLCSVLLALSGRGAFELVQDSYAMSLVGMFVPFVVGIYRKRLNAAAANASIIVGIGSWLLHVVLGWDYFAQAWLGEVVPHELADTLLSAAAFWVALAERSSASVRAEEGDDQPPMD